MTDPEQRPPGTFQEWLVDQSGRDDPVGDLAQEIDDGLDLEKVQEEYLGGGRSTDADAFGEAHRQYAARRAEWLSLQNLLKIETVIHDLLIRFHAETECGVNGRHYAQCQALTFAFGWESWDSWAAYGEVLNDLEPGGTD